MLRSIKVALHKYIQSILGIFFVSHPPLTLSLRERIAHYRRSIGLTGEALYILSRYTPELRRTIHRAKYSHDGRAISSLSDFCHRAYEHLPMRTMMSHATHIYLISPRSHIWTRLWRRGDFVGDMSHLWREMLRSKGYHVTEVRVSHRWSYGHQALRSRVERSQKRNRFFLANTDLRSIVDDGVFIYLDDVISTGSTLREIQLVVSERVLTISSHRSFFICLSSSHI